MASKFSQIGINVVFQAKGGSFRKIDDLYYEDLNTGFQQVWNPMFDETIQTGSPAPKTANANTTEKFIVDPQSRSMKPNPNYEGDERDRILEDVRFTVSTVHGTPEKSITIEELPEIIRKWADIVYYKPESEGEKFELQPVPESAEKSEAEQMFREMSESGAFGDAEPHEYALMADIATCAAGAMTQLAKLTETDDAMIFYPLIVDTLTRAYKAYAPTPKEANNRAWEDLMTERKILTKRAKVIEKDIKKKSAKPSAKKKTAAKKAVKKSAVKKPAKSAKRKK